MNLNELANKLVRDEPHDAFPITRGGPGVSVGGVYPGLDYTRGFLDLYPVIGNEGRTRVVLSAAFWQVLTSTEIFQSLLKQLGLQDPLCDGGRLILSIHGNDDEPRYDLLILSPHLPADQMRSLPLERLLHSFSFIPGDFTRASEQWINSRYKELNTSRQENLLTEGTYKRQTLLLEALTPRRGLRFVEELIQAQRFSLLLAPMPKMVPTNAVVSPAWGIGLGMGTAAISTAGVFTTDRQGRFGVTACLHGVVASPDTIYDMFNAQGAAAFVDKTVYVDNQPGIIRSVDLITDSCFIELDPQQVPNSQSNQGPLKDKPPYRREPVMFEGLTSSKQNTVITDIDVSIPLVGRGEQAKVYTPAVTNPGDSGAALVNKDGYVLGFNHRRTGLGESIEFAEWIWAQSVYNALRL